MLKLNAKQGKKMLRIRIKIGNPDPGRQKLSPSKKGKKFGIFTFKELPPTPLRLRVPLLRGSAKQRRVIKSSVSDLDPDLKFGPRQAKVDPKKGGKN
jgi:hypothetical protein